MADQKRLTSGLSPSRLARVHEILRRHVDARLPGLVGSSVGGARSTWRPIGSLAFDRPVPMRRDTIFGLASLTKPVTAVGAMILVEECTLRLDDPVDAWLPELANRRVLRTLDRLAGGVSDRLPDDCWTKNHEPGGLVTPRG